MPRSYDKSDVGTFDVPDGISAGRVCRHIDMSLSPIRRGSWGASEIGK